VLDPATYADKISQRPCSVFMARSLWRQAEETLKILDPDLAIHEIKPDGSLIVAELR
jgi:hypothetical protein